MQCIRCSDIAQLPFSVCLLTQFILPRGRIQTNQTIPDCECCVSGIHMLFVSSLLPLLTINTPFAFLMVTKLRAGSPFFYGTVLIPTLPFLSSCSQFKSHSCLWETGFPMYIILNFRTLVFICHFFTQFVWGLRVPSAT